MYRPTAAPPLRSIGCTFSSGNVADGCTSIGYHFSRPQPPFRACGKFYADDVPSIRPFGLLRTRDHEHRHYRGDFHQRRCRISKSQRFAEVGGVDLDRCSHASPPRALQTGHAFEGDTRRSLSRPRDQGHDLIVGGVVCRYSKGRDQITVERVGGVARTTRIRESSRLRKRYAALDADHGSSPSTNRRPPIACSPVFHRLRHLPRSRRDAPIKPYERRRLTRLETGVTVDVSKRTWGVSQSNPVREQASRRD